MSSFSPKLSAQNRLGDKFLIHFFNPSNRWRHIDDMSALEKEDSVLEFMSESGLAVAFDCKYKCFILSQRLVSARITFFYVQYPAISKILAILTKNDNSSRSDGR